MGLALVLAPSTPVTASDGIDTLIINASALPHFYPSQPERATFGPLTYLGGLSLSSSHGTFEALSGLDLVQDSDSERLVAVTDEGHWVTARLISDAEGRPLTLEDAVLGPLLGPDGAPLGSKRLADAEAISLVDDTLWVGFERNQPVRAYRWQDDRLEGAATLPLGDQEPLPAGRNSGVEALVHITEGPLTGQTVLFLEEARWQNASTGAHPSAARVDQTGTLIPFAIRRLDRFAITGAAMLPGGDVILVERFFTWSQGIAMRLRAIRANDILAGAASGVLLLEARGDSIIDNMEAIAVSDHPNGPILTLLSDDNGSFLQSTVLLRFQITAPLVWQATPMPPSPLARPNL